MVQSTKNYSFLSCLQPEVLSIMNKVKIKDFGVYDTVDEGIEAIRGKN